MCKLLRQYHRIFQLLLLLDLRVPRGFLGISGLSTRMECQTVLTHKLVMYVSVRSNIVYQAPKRFHYIQAWCNASGAAVFAFGDQLQRHHSCFADLKEAIVLNLRNQQQANLFPSPLPEPRAHGRLSLLLPFLSFTTYTWGLSRSSA